LLAREWQLAMELGLPTDRLPYAYTARAISYAELNQYHSWTAVDPMH